MPTAKTPRTSNGNICFTKRHRLEQIVAQALDRLHVEAEIEKVTDFNKFIDYGVLSTPVLVINDTTVSSGRLPSVSEIAGFITDAQPAT